MKLIPELSVKNRIAVPVIVTKRYEIYEGYFGRRMRVLAKLDDNIIKIVNAQNISDIEIPSLPVRRDLDFSILEKCRSLLSLSIHVGVPVDWKAIQRLPLLRALRLKTSGLVPDQIDFTVFKNLEYCAIQWHREWSSVLESSALLHLSLIELTGVKVLELDRLPHLRELCVYSAKGLTAVEFVSTKKMESLGFFGCRAFRSVKPEGTLDKIKYLLLRECPKFDITAITRCKQLKRLWLNSMGEIASIQFLQKCEGIESMQMLGTTNVLDGDLSVLERLPHLRDLYYKNRAHYRPRHFRPKAEK